MSKKVKASFLYIVGKTQDGRDVVAGAFRFRETYGLPLEVLAEALQANGAVVSWPHYVQEALSAGSKPASIKASITSAFVDLFGMKEHEVSERVSALVSRLQEEKA